MIPTARNQNTEWCSISRVNSVNTWPTRRVWRSLNHLIRGARPRREAREDRQNTDDDPNFR